MKNIEVVLSPLLMDVYDLEGKDVAIIDVFRATSTICHALNSGFQQAITTADASLALTLKASDTDITAGERDGRKLEGFDMGNSPCDIREYPHAKGRFIISSTNGTQCIQKSIAKKAAHIYIASLNNVGYLSTYLRRESDLPLVICCSGWKGRPNIEDTYMAGGLIAALSECKSICDSGLMALQLYLHHSGQPDFLKQTTHYRRLKNMGCGEDLALCCEENTTPVVPVLQSYTEDTATFTDALRLMDH
jgi:2-phosphosulfolactate phosphatase